MMNTLLEQALSLLDWANYDAFFAFVAENVGLVGELADLRKEFMNKPTPDHLFPQRLRTWAQTHIEASKEGVAGFETKKYIFNRDFQFVTDKTKQNRGIGTSEVLQDKTTDDLQPDDLALLFRQDEALERLGEDADKLTAQEKLRLLALAENGHIYKGTFLAIGKHFQFRAVCESALESKFTYFKGKERLDDIAFENVTGNILHQYNRMMFLLRQHIPKRRDRSKDENVYEVPIEALREFVANAFVHRDYSQETRTTVYVEIFDDRIEIRNPGAFPKGTQPNRIIESVLINPTMMAVFMLHNHVEQKGTGINRAQRILEAQGLPKADIDFGNDEVRRVTVTIYRPT
ncbi:MAG: hypothetical protein EAZ95_03855 [Bacteroidetes bacterium]|nr:MAG: hypothetical protein EAZ95_03855 [Bacteroidota bacterium]